MKTKSIIFLGIKKYYKNDKLHRVDGPAIEYENGDGSWYIDGLLHREDGPAIDWEVSQIYKDNCQWWLCGNLIAKGANKPENWDRLVREYRAKKLLEI
jgi:hypothetical protein